MNFIDINLIPSQFEHAKQALAYVKDERNAYFTLYENRIDLSDAYYYRYGTHLTDDLKIEYKKYSFNDKHIKHVRK